MIEKDQWKVGNFVVWEANSNSGNGLNLKKNKRKLNSLWAANRVEADSWERDKSIEKFVGGFLRLEMNKNKSLSSK